jgi:ABC-2 type transport system permease protein/sodium transport system permease protein
VAALLPGLSPNGPLAVVPLLNIVLLSRDLLAGEANAAAAGVVVVTTLVYSVGAVALAARIFGTEAVLSSEQSGWADLFRRPDQAQPALGVPAALLCVALMFPVNFLLSTGLGKLTDLSLPGRLGLTAASNLVLFTALPFLFVWFGHIRLSDGLRLRAPGLAAWGVAALLGLSLWPWTHELILVLRQFGVSSLRQDYLERLAKAVEEWRTVSPVLLVLVLAVVPAVLEELFFRGLLFSALLGERGCVSAPSGEPGRVSAPRARAAVLGSAVLFALFHILVPGALSVERLLSSLAMGLVLGCLAYTCGSVMPGMLLHVLYNGLALLAAYYAPQLVESGLLNSTEDHLPGWLLLVSGAGAVVGLAGLAWLWQRR